jgi:hypothetical protein
MLMTSTTSKWFNVLTLVATLFLDGCSTVTPASPQATGSALLGTWRLVSFGMEVQGHPDKTFPMGKMPVGYISFMPDDRMAVVITAEGRKPAASDQERAALYNSLVAYVGRFRVEGDRWITTVDASANPAWVGTEQPRTFKIAGDNLQETTPWFPRSADKSMVRVVNTYERVK